jgi:CRISPR/Cas system endoribonuclease Cas6 (RAMP superfamily)
MNNLFPQLGNDGLYICISNNTNMELSLTFRNLGSSTIPIDYNYHLGSWIYHILAEADQEYEDFLHNEGCHNSENDQRAFKLFCA